MNSKFVEMNWYLKQNRKYVDCTGKDVRKQFRIKFYITWTNLIKAICAVVHAVNKWVVTAEISSLLAQLF